MIRIVAFTFLYCMVICAHAAERYTISGYITDKGSGETLIGAAILVEGTSTGTVTNNYGYYAMSLPEGRYVLSFRYIGYQPMISDTFSLNADTAINVVLRPVAVDLDGVVIEAERPTRVTDRDVTSSLSKFKIEVKDMAGIPSVGGEVDVFKVVQLMPGVKKGIEGSAGMFVRGGDGDQNLILLDEATVYNAAHLFGFFSVFNPDALNDVTLVKAGFPASYGGRLSSVMDIRMKEGRMDRFSAEGGVGLLSSKITLQGPIKKDTSSFMISGRRTYIDQVVRIVEKGDPLPYYFYDLNAKVNYRFTDKDRIFLSTYLGDDVLRFKADVEESLFNFRFLLGNFTATARWNHVYGKRLFSNVSLIHTRFRYDVSGAFAENSILIGSSIQDYQMKADFDYFQSPRSHVRFGATSYKHHFRPNVVSTSGDLSASYASREGDLVTTNEIAFYMMNDRKIGNRMTVTGGLRYSAALTQKTVYSNAEPRFSTSLRLGAQGYLKASYSRMAQYMHLVSSSSIALPTDLWYPVTKRVQPQQADHYAIGFENTFEKSGLLLGLETYYKEMHSIVEYREGAQLILNDNYEDELIKGTGTAYGVEFIAKRSKGRVTGWVGYTLSWSKRQFDELNHGEPFFARYDRRHDLSVVTNLRISERLRFAVVWTYASGAWFTPLTGQFFMPNSSLSGVDILPIYSGKNSVRFPNAHRLDANLMWSSKPDKRFHSEWHFGAYNIYNRTQPFLTEVVTGEDGTVKYVARGLFGFIPSVAYNFKF
ncbi:MAG: TonB-dependent receptor [Flavobacteriales bacterium]|nr:TonB-dependent receptor [Flavobacteriales bacterium]